MALKFITSYPMLPQGVRTPCGIAIDRQSGIVQEIICPELTAEACRALMARWNALLASSCDGRDFEEELTQFISEEVKPK